MAKCCFLIADFTCFGLTQKMPFEVIMEKFKCRECLPLAYMWRLYGKCKTKFQNIKVTLLVVNQLGYMVHLNYTKSKIPKLSHHLQLQLSQKDSLFCTHSFCSEPVLYRWLSHVWTESTWIPNSLILFLITLWHCLKLSDNCTWKLLIELETIIEAVTEY